MSHNIAPFTFFTSSMIKSGHAFFARGGGVSEGAFESLNFVRGDGETIENIDQNIQRANEFSGLDLSKLTVLHQQCAEEVIVNPDPNRGELQGDAIVTSNKGQAIGIITADCLPILLEDSDAGVIGACHGSWNGVLNSVVTNTIEAMVELGATPKKIVAVVGPCIHQESYEIGSEIFEKFCAQDADYERFFTEPHDEDGRRYFNLRGLAKSQMTSMGMKRIDDINMNTYTLPSLFFSHRRNTHENIKGHGDQLSVIIQS